MKEAAKKFGGSEALRKETGLSPDTFYKLLGGGDAKTVKTLKAVRAALRKAGVSLPRDLAA